MKLTAEVQMMLEQKNHSVLAVAAGRSLWRVCQLCGSEPAAE